MNFTTNFILNSYPSDIEELNIINLSIKGVLDLKRFTSLVKLDCSFNHITDIINMPDTLEILKCSNNKLKSLTNSIENNKRFCLISCICNRIFPSVRLPNSLKEINCSFNEIEKIYFYDLIILKKLNVSHNKIKKYYLPESLIEFNCIDNYIEELILPQSVQIVYCENNSIMRFDNLPENINVITGKKFQRKPKDRI